MTNAQLFVYNNSKSLIKMQLNYWDFLRFVHDELT